MLGLRSEVASRLASGLGLASGLVSGWIAGGLLLLGIPQLGSRCSQLGERIAGMCLLGNLGTWMRGVEIQRHRVLEGTFQQHIGHTRCYLGMG